MTSSNASRERPGFRISPERVIADGLAWLGYAFLLLPTLIVIPLSFADSAILSFPPKNLSLRHYETYFFASDWLSTTGQSLKIASIVTAISLVLGVGAAYGLGRSEFRGKKLVLLLLLSPMFVPGIVIGLALYLYFARFGLTGTTTGLIIGHTLVVMPFVIVTASAGLRHIDRNIETAGRIMGASNLTIVRTITLPLLLPSILAGGVFAFLMSFDEVVVSYFLASVDSQTLPLKMYNSIQWEISPVIAAISSLLTILSLVACLITMIPRRGTQ